MILKGSQRGNGGDLAIHLMNGYDNERVEIAQVHGAVADDLYGAFAEFEAIAAGTKARQPLYSLSINPSAPLTRDQYDEAIAEIEKRLGLAGQPRAIVFHVKDGREHCHVVWSRINVEKMRAIHMAHDHRRLCDLSCELAHKYGLELPPGLKAWEKKQRFEKQKLEPTLAENAQSAKTGISPEQRRKEITAAYDRSDNAEAFRAALAQQGYILARGDRRGLVVVDKFTHVHSLTRYIDGHTARQIKKKLAPLAPEDLPSVDQAKELVRSRGEKQAEGQGEKASDLAEKSREAERQALAEKQAARRAELAGDEQDMLMRQASEKLALHAAQESEKKRLLFRVRSAVSELIGRVPGLRSVLGHIQKLTHLDPGERHVLEREALSRRHAREKLDIERRRRGLDRLDARERQSLEKALARSAEQARTLRQKTGQEFDEEARDDGLWRKREFKEGELSVEFNDAGEFVEGADDDDDDDERALSWKARTKKIRRGHRPRRGKGPGYRRDDE